jgi:membrane-associated phospholipid phosphatase
MRAIGRRLRGAAGAASTHLGTAGFLLASFAGSALLVLPLKHAIGRARPSLFDHDGYPYFKSFAFEDQFLSFPSAHAAMAGSLACSLGLLFPRLRALSITMGLAIPVTRLFVGAHWASDTIVGWAIGTSFSLWLAHRVAQHGLLFGYDDNGLLRRSKRPTPSAA